MSKFLTVIFLSFSALCQAYYGQNVYEQDNSLTARYLRHEISTDEYADSILPKNTGMQVETIYHSNGNRSYIVR